MKKLLLLFVLGFLLYGCGCLSQIPPQYVYVDSACSATIPNYLTSGLVVVEDNCQIEIVTQLPSPGTVISGTTQVEIQATDVSGNSSSTYFNVLLLDTIPPLIQLNPEWTGYTNEEIGTMYKAYYGWVQKMGDYYNANVPGRVDTIHVFDTIYTHVYDSMRIFYGTIPITDPKFRIDQGYWSEEIPDLSTAFNF